MELSSFVRARSRILALARIEYEVSVVVHRSLCTGNTVRRVFLWLLCVDWSAMSHGSLAATERPLGIVIYSGVEVFAASMLPPTFATHR